MAHNAADSRARQEHILRGSEQRVTAPKRPAVPTPATHSRIVVIRSVDTTTGLITVQEIAYATDPPVVGSYETVGEPFAAYPLETAVAADYELFVWSEEEHPEITTETVPVRVVHRRGRWIVEFILKAGASLLDPDAEVNPCSSG